jgi:type I restriction enzyme S subunit
MTFHSNFPLAPLRDVVQFINGDRSSNYPKGADYVASGIPFISAADLGDGEVNFASTRKVSATAYDRLRSGKIQRDDILFCLRGSIGKIAHIKEPQAGAIASSLVIIRAGESIDPRYLFFGLSSQAGQQAAVGLNNGAAQPNLSVSELQNIEIPLPSRPIQRRIAGILSAYDDLIENSQRRIKILEEMARRLYREWFVDFRFPGHEDCRLVKSSVGEIPEGWEVKPFSAIASYVNGYPFKPAELGPAGKPIIKIKELKAGIVADTPRNTGDEIPGKYHIHDGDVLFSWSADLDAYLWMGGDGLLNQHLFTVLPADAFSLAFCFHSLKESMPRFRALSLGATMHHIKRSALDQVFTVVAPTPMRNRFDVLVEPIHQQLITISKQIQNLRQSRDLLLPRLLSGQIDVEALPEPVLSES